MINNLINLILGRTNIMSHEYQAILPQTLAGQRLKLFPRHGTFTIDSAQMVEEEEVEEIVREKRELPPEPEEVKETKDRAGAIWVLIGVGLMAIPIEVSKVVFNMFQYVLVVVVPCYSSRVYQRLG